MPDLYWDIFCISHDQEFPYVRLIYVASEYEELLQSRFFYKRQENMPNHDYYIGLIILSVTSNVFYKYSKISRRFGVGIDLKSLKAVDFVRQNDIEGPVFNDFGSGNLLIWKFPEQKIFIDSRPEAYPKDFAQNIYLAMLNDPKKWDFYSEKYNINYIFFNYPVSSPSNKKFIDHISDNPKWPLVFQGGGVLVFVKMDLRNIGIIQKYAEIEIGQ